MGVLNCSSDRDLAWKNMVQWILTRRVAPGMDRGADCPLGPSSQTTYSDFGSVGTLQRLTLRFVVERPRGERGNSHVNVD